MKKSKNEESKTGRVRADIPKATGHITKAERREIALLLQKKYSRQDIADALGRDISTIKREIFRNSVNGEYDPDKAHAKYRVRRQNSKYEAMKITRDQELEAYIKDKLKQAWTPEEISGRIKKHDHHITYVSTRCIYKWLYSNRGQAFCQYLPSKRYRRKKQKKKAGKQSHIPNRVGIEERPEAANAREECGHGETDLIVSGKTHNSTSALNVTVDRKSRYVKLKKLLSQKPAENNAALEEAIAAMNLQTLTADNGLENRRHEMWSVNGYFCNPYSSWEKGSVENVNWRIRRFIPKGANIADIPDEEIVWLERWLNHTPRKCLDFKTPFEVTLEESSFTLNQPVSMGAVRG